MTALNRADIPATITTVEQLQAWCSVVLSSINLSTTAIEGRDATNSYSTRVAIAEPWFMSAVNTDLHWRFISRASLRMNPDWVQGSSKIWTRVQELNTTTPVPDALKV
jgi:hypothetical protein